LVVRPRLMAALFRSLPPLTADRVVAVSDAVRRHLFAPWRRAAVVVVRNGIGSRVPSPMPGLRSNGGSVVAFVGRLNRWKGYELFVAAAETVASRYPDARFVI